MEKEAKIYVAGHLGLVGSAIVGALQKKGYHNILTVERNKLDLRDAAAVKEYFEMIKPEYVFLAAAKVGGIKANQENPAGFLFDNLMIQNNLIDQSMKNGVKKLCFLGSSCIYPKECLQPMKEEYILTGPLEPTNEGYALAKIAGLKMAQYYDNQYGLKCVCPMPCNIYGIGDSFDLDKSHVISALVKRFCDAAASGKDEIILWGTGRARREFMWSSDLANAAIFLMEQYNSPEIINIGWGEDITIKKLAELIAQKTGYKGKLLWDSSKPDGMMKKCLDVSKMKAWGFSPKIQLDEGIGMMVSYYNEIKKKEK